MDDVSNTVAQHRALIAAARQRQILAKEAADAARDRAYAEADVGLIDAVKVARKAGVPWKDIAASSGITHQRLHKILKGG